MQMNPQHIIFFLCDWAPSGKKLNGKEGLVIYHLEAPDEYFTTLENEIIMSFQHQHTGASSSSTAMCSHKRISCLSKTSFRFCFRAGGEIYLYGRIKHCPYQTECNGIEGRNACLENNNTIGYPDTTTISGIKIWTTEIQETSNNHVSGHSDHLWSQEYVPYWSDIFIPSAMGLSPSIPESGTHDDSLSTIPLTTISKATLGGGSSSPTPERKHKKRPTPTISETKTSTRIHIVENLPYQLSPTKPNLNKFTITKIKRKRPAPSISSSKSKRKKKPTRTVEKQTTVPFSTYTSGGTLVMSFTTSPKFSKEKRKKKPQRYSSTTQDLQYTSIQPSQYPSTTPLSSLEFNGEETTSTRITFPIVESTKQSPNSSPSPVLSKEPSKQWKKKKRRKKPTKASTTSSVTKTVSISTRLATSALPLKYSSVPDIFTSATSIELSPTSENQPIPSTTIIPLAAPLPCPYYLNRLFTRTTSTTISTSTTAANFTPPSSCRSTGKYPSNNCHEYFECLKVMWWYRLMIMKCKRGEGFNATLLQCVPDETCA